MMELGLRGQVDQVGEVRAVTVGGAERELIALRPLQIQVRGVFPGHSDAAVQLDALLGGVDGDVTAVRLDRKSVV